MHRLLSCLLLFAAACTSPPGGSGQPDAGSGDVLPDTRVLERPAGRTESTGARFSFESAPAGLAFECDLDQRGFASCSSPLTLVGLAEGPHVLSVRALDAAGRRDPTPAVVAWEVVAEPTPPDTRIDSGPSDPSTASSATFTFYSTPVGQAFDCRLDALEWTACTSPWTVSALADGAHVFSVRAVDSEGLRDPSPAVWEWRVELPVAGSARLRIVASNLTSGNYQAYEAPGMRILQGLDPDVVLVQEFNYGDNGAAELRSFVDTTFGPTFEFYREPDGQIPNGIVSRWPILESGRWEDAESPNREWAWARIDVPGPVDLWAVSLHLLTRSAGTRATEARGLLPHLQALPAGDFLVVGGDLNTDHTGEAAFDVLAAVVDADGPWPVDQAGVAGTNASRSKPYDHLLVDGDLDRWSAPVAIGDEAFPNGLVFDTRVYGPLEDVAPARAGDSGVSGMQHMAVVRDFLLPE